MYTRNKSTAPTRKRDGLTCHLLLQEGDVRNSRIAVTWVEVEPGSCQLPHRHMPEQIYVIIKGSGQMRIGETLKEVTVGDVVYIPSNMVHGIQNLSSTEQLVYVTAATPSFDIAAMYDQGKPVTATEKL
ncbi:MAG: cupin domain-containing protein [Calditrichaeota bacterium]|nr:MAG: cupin domain-containing protein [Calditrichota bacterium]